MIPFERYQKGGQEPLGLPPSGDGTCRHGYGPPVFAQCGDTCAYCGRALLDSYDAWLSVSVDHVVPRSVSWYSARLQWVEDIFNLVTCCRACNEFLNQYLCAEAEPTTVAAFVDIRNRVFVGKQEHARQRHADERDWYGRWIRDGRPAI